MRMAIDNNRNIYVTGSVDNGGAAGYDYFTLKYDSSGAGKWLKYFDGLGGNRYTGSNSC